uniref:Putative secreted protein n=1 Tax=Anopheles darlingi TaxID=43151 RepID=A0A2M4DH47_ANODA
MLAPRVSKWPSRGRFLSLYIFFRFFSFLLAREIVKVAARWIRGVLAKQHVVTTLGVGRVLLVAIGHTPRSVAQHGA